MTTASRAPRRDARQNRAGILTAAAGALSRDPHASLDAIARCAGLTRRALYGHFDDRDALVREVLDAGAERFNAIAARIDDDDAAVALARLAAELWREAAHVRVTAALALDETHIAETSRALAPLRSRILAIVRRGQHESTLRADVDATTLARLVEETGRTVIARMDPATPGSGSLVVRAVLGIAGLSWREAVALLAAHPELEADA